MSLDLPSEFLRRDRQCFLTSVGVLARAYNDDHHVQANLPAATTTTHAMRNRNIETARSACFLNSLRPSLIRVVRRKKTERMKRKTGIAAARKAMILKIIVRDRCPVYSRPHSITSSAGANSIGERTPRIWGVKLCVPDRAAKPFRRNMR